MWTDLPGEESASNFSWTIASKSASLKPENFGLKCDIETQITIVVVHSAFLDLSEHLKRLSILIILKIMKMKSLTTRAKVAKRMRETAIFILLLRKVGWIEESNSAYIATAPIILYGSISPFPPISKVVRIKRWRITENGERKRRMNRLALLKWTIEHAQWWECFAFPMVRKRLLLQWWCIACIFSKKTILISFRSGKINKAHVASRRFLKVIDTERNAWIMRHDHSASHIIPSIERRWKRVIRNINTYS